MSAYQHSYGTGGSGSTVADHGLAITSDAPQQASNTLGHSGKKRSRGNRHTR